MLDQEVLKVKVSGEYACFTRPDLKVERMSYPCMTPSAARGVLEAILWKPEFQWYIHRILVLKPVKFISIKRNEINSKQGGTPVIIENEREQRNSIILRDVAYIIEASIYQEVKDNQNPNVKYREMFQRRVRKGQCWRRPYLGTREFSADFCESSGNDKPIDDTIPIGSMLFDMFYDKNGKPNPVFFYDVAIINGILDLPEKLNLDILRSSHIRPSSDNPYDKASYELKQNEEGRVEL